MSKLRRATVYLDLDLHRALRIKAAQAGQTISQLVNAAIRTTMGEDAEDLAACRSRAKEPNLDFGTVLKKLRRRGSLA